MPSSPQSRWTPRCAGWASPSGPMACSTRPHTSSASVRIVLLWFYLLQAGCFRCKGQPAWVSLQHPSPHILGIGERGTPAVSASCSCSPLPQHPPCVAPSATPSGIRGRCPHSRKCCPAVSPLPRNSRRAWLPTQLTPRVPPAHTTRRHPWSVPPRPQVLALLPRGQLPLLPHHRVQPLRQEELPRG